MAGIRPALLVFQRQVFTFPNHYFHERSSLIRGDYRILEKLFFVSQPKKIMYRENVSDQYLLFINKAH